MQEPGPDLPCDTVPGALRSDVRLFLVFTFFGSKILQKFPKCQGPLLNLNPSQAVT